MDKVKRGYICHIISDMSKLIILLYPQEARVPNIHHVSSNNICNPHVFTVSHSLGELIEI